MLMLGVAALKFFNTIKGSLIQSFQLGAVRNLHKKDKQKEWRRLKDWIISTNLNSHLIGIGGNVRSFFKCQKEDEMNQEIFLLNIKNLRCSIGKR